MKVRTRIEPSPSGSLHVGNAMTAAFNWLWARKHGGQFVLRIADTDQARVTPEGIRSALEDFRWLGLDWDEGPEVGGPHEPYFQSKRMDLYRAAGARLLAEGHAYRCICTQDELAQRREAARAEGRAPGYDGRCRDLTPEDRARAEADGKPSVVRFRVPAGETTITDLVRGEVVFDHQQIEDFVILRADGSALYMLCATYDDVVMELTHIIRGEDIFPSTPKQILLMQALGAPAIPAYAHLPLIVGQDRQKLSKRHGPTSIVEYRDRGFLPETMVNYLALLNWSVGDGKTERFTMDELIEAFDLSGVTRNPSAFDPVKLEALNGEKIRSLSTTELLSRLQPFLVRDGVLTDEPEAAQREILAKLAPLIQERMKRLDEAPGQLRFLFAEVTPDQKAAAAIAGAPFLDEVADLIDGVEPWTVEAITDVLMTWADASGMKRKDALQPIRAAVAGSLVSPPLFESIEALGRARTVGRLRRPGGSFVTPE